LIIEGISSVCNDLGSMPLPDFNGLLVDEIRGSPFGSSSVRKINENLIDYIL